MTDPIEAAKRTYALYGRNNASLREVHEGALRAAIAAYEQAKWRPIEEAPKQKHPMIVVRGYFADRDYLTDPWCVFWQEGGWQRWPHKDQPTMFYSLPEPPKEPK